MLQLTVFSWTISHEQYLLTNITHDKDTGTSLDNAPCIDERMFFKFKLHESMKEGLPK